jgi:hypothetical protein
MDATAAKTMPGSALNPIEILNAEPIEILDVEPVEILDAEQVVVQSPPLPSTVVSALETNVEETAATVESAPVVVETQDEGSTQVDVDDVNDFGCDDLAQFPSVPQPVEPVVIELLNQGDGLQEKCEKLEREISELQQQLQDSEVDVDDANADGCDDIPQFSGEPQPVEPSALQDEEIISALETKAETKAATVESAPVVVETQDEVDVDGINNDGCDDIPQFSGVPQSIEAPLEPSALQDEKTEDNSPLALAMEPPNEKTPEETVLNEGLIPSVEDKTEDEEESTAIHDALLQPTTESKVSSEETNEEKMQETVQYTAEETATRGTTEGDPENNHEEPTSINMSSVLSQPIKSDESPREDIDTTFEVTDDEEDLEDPMQETPEKFGEDAATCKAENDNSAMASVARSSGDQKNGYDSHTSNESPEPRGYVSSVEVYSQVGADGKVPMDPKLIEQGRAGGALNETKALFPEKTLWDKHKVKCALGCFLLLVIVVVVLAVLLASCRSGHGASPSPSPTAASSAYDLQEFLKLLPDYSQAALLDEASPQAKAFAWLQRDSDLALYSEFQRLQRFALATLFYATNGEQWSNNDGWVENFPFDECDWFMGDPRSIEECVNGRHEELTLDLNGLVGTLPDELAMMTDLKILQLGFNGLKGGIPSRYGLLTNLQTLSLYLNIFDGRIPSELGRLTALEDIDLTLNSLTGPIPSEVLRGWNKVRELRISGNSFSGAIPSEVGGLKNAEYIDFSDNALEGQIPTEFALLTNLETLYLHNNAGISGQIPSVLGSLSQLQIITFDNTNISGAVPRELCDLMQRNFVVVEVDCSRVTCDCGCTCV